MTDRPVEYFILMEPRADGPAIGEYAGQPIYATVVDYFGRRFTYAGIVPRLRTVATTATRCSPVNGSSNPA